MNAHTIKHTLDSLAHSTATPPNNNIPSSSTAQESIERSAAEQRWNSDGGHHEAPPAEKNDMVVGTHSLPVAPRQANQWLESRRAYERYEAVFRNHHRSQATILHIPYEHYRLVYRYGYELGIDRRYTSALWEDVAIDACPRWEERNPGTWNKFQGVIQYAWNTSRTWHES